MIIEMPAFVTRPTGKVVNNALMIQQQVFLLLLDVDRAQVPDVTDAALQVDRPRDYRIVRHHGGQDVTMALHTKQFAPFGAVGALRDMKRRDHWPADYFLEHADQGSSLYVRMPHHELQDLLDVYDKTHD